MASRPAVCLLCPHHMFSRFCASHVPMFCLWKSKTDVEIPDDGGVRDRNRPHCRAKLHAYAPLATRPPPRVIPEQSERLCFSRSRRVAGISLVIYVNRNDWHGRVCAHVCICVMECEVCTCIRAGTTMYHRVGSRYISCFTVPCKLVSSRCFARFSLGIF